jgi:hypothetical protein
MASATWSQLHGLNNTYNPNHLISTTSFLPFGTVSTTKSQPHTVVYTTWSQNELIRTKNFMNVHYSNRYILTLQEYIMSNTSNI